MTATWDDCYLVQLDNFYMNDFMFLWVYYSQPCSLYMRRPNTQGYTAIYIKSIDTFTKTFLLKAQQKCNIVIYKNNKIYDIQ